MLSDSKKQQITTSITQAFNKWSEKYHQNLFVKSDDSDYPNAFKTAVKEQRFLEKRALELGLYISVLKSCNSNKTISKHRKTLTKSCILSIIDDSFTLPDLLQNNTKSQSTDETVSNLGYTRRQMQRLIHENYDESFFETNSQINSKDERINHFSSVFSDVSLPDNSVGIEVKSYLQNQQKVLASNNGVFEKLFFNSVLRFAFPQFFTDLVEFKEECKTVFENLGRTNDRIDFLREELTKFCPTLTTFYSHLTSLLALEWFRQKSEKMQISILDSKLKLQYKKSDAENVKNQLVSLTNSNDYSSFLLYHCANAFVYYNDPINAISLFEQCRGLSDGIFEKGTHSQNIAVGYRLNNNFKLMLKEAKKALSYYEKTDKIYHICLALKLIGEAKYYLGFKESAISSFLDVEKRANSLEQNKWKVLFNIGMSFHRLREIRYRDKYLVKCLSIIPEDQTEMIIRVNQILGFK